MHNMFTTFIVALPPSSLHCPPVTQTGAVAEVALLASVDRTIPIIGKKA